MNIPSTKSFSAELFGALADCDIWPLAPRWETNPLRGLMDHGFIANRACIWGGDDLEGHEIAVVARTYCSDVEIDNPPDGLRCIRLGNKFMGSSVGHGTAIAIVVIAPTPAASLLLSSCACMPADMLAYAIPLNLIRQGWAIVLAANERSRYPDVGLIDLAEDSHISIKSASLN